MKPHNLPPIHPEWVQRDHMLIAWAYTHNDERYVNYPNGGIDSFGIPILTPEMRKHLGDEWYKWSKMK